MTTTWNKAVLARFWAKVDKTDACWLWTASGTHNGYGTFRYPRTVTNYVHRVAYELLVGPIAEGLVIDHLCRNRACLNPEHLEPVTQRENVLRGVGLPATRSRQTHCGKGHEFTEPNTYHRPDRPHTRDCRTCRRIANQQAELRRRGRRRAAA